MALRPCRECGLWIEESLPECTHCGAEDPVPEEGRSTPEAPITGVSLRAVDVPFDVMVGWFLKAAIAAIPAVLVLLAVVFLFALVWETALEALFAGTSDLVGP